MTQLTVATERPKPTLRFVPQQYYAAFMRDMLEEYSFVAEAPNSRHVFREPSFPPDVAAEVASVRIHLYLIGVLAAVTGNPTELEDRLADAGGEDERSDLFDDLYEEFHPQNEPALFDAYVEDICALYDYFQLTYITSWSDPFHFAKRYYTMHNHALIEVW